MREAEIERQLTARRLEIEELRRQIRKLTSPQISEVSYYMPNLTASGGGGGSSVWFMRAPFDYTIEDPIQVGPDVGSNHFRVAVETGKTVQLIASFVQMKNPVIGDIVFDFQKATVLSPETWASIFNSGDANKPRALDAAYTATPVTSFALATLSNDDLIRLDVLAVGSNTAVSGEVVLFGRIA